MINLRSFFVLFVLVLFYAGAIPSCAGEESSGTKERKRTVPQTEPRSLKLEEPALSGKIKAGEDVTFTLAWADSVGVTDSVEIYLDAMLVQVLNEGLLTTDISTKGVYPGSKRIRAIVYHSSGKKETYVSQIMLLSDIVPQAFSYVVKKTYPHDIGAYTQGFEYHNGFFYEGTGQYGESSIRKTEMLTGDILKARSLPGDIFGEGITILNNKIFQITYRSQVGFVYDLQTFELLQKIYYQNQEGWGLSNNGESVIMSDGTPNIYFMDPEYFHVTRKLEVMDHTGPVDAINELEWIDGKIWANRYLTEEIVIIDPESGKVEGKINMSGLLGAQDKHPKIDVLNGIAWDKENRRLFVTGKYWPKIYEIELVKTSY